LYSTIEHIKVCKTIIHDVPALSLTTEAQLFPAVCCLLSTTIADHIVNLISSASEQLMSEKSHNQPPGSPDPLDKAFAESQMPPTPGAVTLESVFKSEAGKAADNSGGEDGTAASSAAMLEKAPIKLVRPSDDHKRCLRPPHVTL